MKKIFIPIGLSVLLLGACLPFFEKDKGVVIKKLEESTEEMILIANDQLTVGLYRTYTPYKKSVSQGLIVDNINTKYDMKESEEGLSRLSAQHFDPKTYYFQEGQYIDKDTVKAWLSRSSVNQEGLNPPTTDKMDKQAPIYLAHIVEQNYLVMNDQKEVQLGGISIGLVMNSIYYTKEGRNVEIPADKMATEGKRFAEKVVRQLREMDGLSDVPIVVGLFKQQNRESISPGSYFASAVAVKGKSELSNWTSTKEQYFILPAWSESEGDIYRDINEKFKKFKEDIDKYFPSYVDVIGTLHDKDNNSQSMKIEIPIQFFGTSEIIGFTQYITLLIIEYFPDIHTEVNITSVNGPVALIVNGAGKDQPHVHIYGH